MAKPFEIRFDFPLEHSNYTIPLCAVAELHHSEPYYIVDSFTFGEQNPSRRTISLLPSVEIKYVKKNGRGGTWVHKESERESLLSRAIGKAIETSGWFTGE